jgi:hypothetical protein
MNTRLLLCVGVLWCGALVATACSGRKGAPAGEGPDPDGYVLGLKRVNDTTIDCLLKRNLGETVMGLAFEVQLPDGVSIQSVTDATALGALTGGHVAAGVRAGDPRRIVVAAGMPAGGGQVVGADDLLSFRLTTASALPNNLPNTSIIDSSTVFLMSSTGDFAEARSSILLWSAVVRRT